MDILGLVNLPTWLLGVIIFLVAAYIYLTWNFGVWKAQGIPGPKPLPLFGNLLPMLKIGFMENDRIRIKEHGKIVGVFIGRRPDLMIADLDMLKHIMIKESHLFMNHQGLPGFDEFPFRKGMNVLRDEEWKNVRVLLTPTFSGKKIRRMIQHMNRCSKVLVEHLTKKVEKDESFEAKEYLGAFTMDVIAATAFGLQLDTQGDRNNMFIKKARVIFDRNPIRPILLVMIMAPFLMKYLAKIGITFVPQDVVDFFCKIVDDTIEAREKEKIKEPDFLQLMLDAHKDNDDSESTQVQQQDKTQQKGNEETQPGEKAHKGLDKEELLAQALLFFLAGYETVNTAMSFLAYLLALNPECQKKLQQEIDQVMEDEDTPTYELIAKMTYMDMCINETLRIYPPAGRTDRQCTGEHDVVINDLHIPKGTIIGIPVYAIHHDPDIWPEPEKFDPERFTAEAKAERHPMAWLPFGEGPRHCIGMRLALSEIKVVMVHILRRFSFITCEETQIPVKLKINTTMPVEPGLILKLAERSQE